MEDVSDECFFLFLNLSVVPSREILEQIRSGIHTLYWRVYWAISAWKTRKTREEHFALGIIISVSYLL